MSETTTIHIAGGPEFWDQMVEAVDGLEEGSETVVSTSLPGTADRNGRQIGNVSVVVHVVSSRGGDFAVWTDECPYPEWNEQISALPSKP